MMKQSVVALALLGTTSAAASATASASHAAKFDLKNKKEMREKQAKIMEEMKSKGTLVSTSSANIDTSAYQEGNWLLLSDGTCGDDDQLYTSDYGYQMDMCILGTKYECSFDTSSNTMKWTYKSYSKSDCSSTYSSYTFTYNMGCDGYASGVTVTCSDTDLYSDAQSGGGLFLSWYDTESGCNNDDSSDVLFFSRLKGCSYGMYYGDSELSYYSNSDCTGSVQYSFSYSELYNYDCFSSNYFDDDDDDDDIYDDFEYYFAYGGGGGSGDDDCFHVDTKIDYKGVQYSYEDLKAGKEPECTVPHSPFSKGVVITASCDDDNKKTSTVRVTDTHLMATTKGFQLAYSLKAGDVLFGGYDNKDQCIVQSVEKEKTTQQYFGLNCVHSEVLASGLRASTFGDFHTLPSWYMTYVGGLVGKDTASYLGEYIAEWYFQK